ncbi:MAG: HD domain-containing protein [Eubacterium sp.]|nr:HD domain-containing protein [Eubacterium sp.]
MIFVKVDDLKAGMRLGKPIYNKNGVLLYDRDTKLSMQAIYGIKNFNLMGLYILEPAEPLPPMTEDDINFERFQTMSVFSIREDLDLIALGKKDKGLDWLVSLVIKNYSTLDHKINFVQSLRSSEDFVYKHVLNVAILSALIGGQLGVKGGRLNTIIKAAVLHDIGVTRLNEVPDGANVDPEIRRVIKNNTDDILRAYGELDDEVLKLISQMQELYVREGTGDEVPEALKMNVNANILFVADTYDRLTAMKSETEPTSEILAIRHLLDNEDTYDPMIVNALVKAINILYPGVCVELEVTKEQITGEVTTRIEKGLVIRGNEDAIFEPIVIAFDSNTMYDISLPTVKSEVKIIDVMKTMDNRIQLDHDLLDQYAPLGPIHE